MVTGDEGGTARGLIEVFQAHTQPVRPPVRSRGTWSRRTILEIPGDRRSRSILLLVVVVIVIVIVIIKASSSGRRRELGNPCSSDADCVSGLSCYNCNGFTGKKCVRTTIANPFNTVGTSLPFNKYAFLTTHNSFSITGVKRFTLYNQEDSVTDQLNNGVRALMLDVYDFRDDIWLCHSLGGKCFFFTAFEPAIYTMREIEAFLLTNPSEIVTLILEDHVTSHHGLSKLFNKTGLMKYWFPVSRMPRDGEDWPRVSDMIKLNHRLLVFTSNRSKESCEEIAYQWNYMVENQYGNGGMDSDVCYNRLESPVLSDRTKSLVLVNYFRTILRQWTACMEHSRGLVDVLNTCYAAAGNRWANFLAVDYYKRSDGGGVFQATDMLNGMLICGRNDVRACRKRTLKGALYDLLDKLGLVWKGIGATRLQRKTTPAVSSSPLKTLNPPPTPRRLIDLVRKSAEATRSFACFPRRRRGEESDGEASAPVAEPGAGGEAGAAKEERRRYPPPRDLQLNSGKVVAVGPGERNRDGKLIPVALKEGDTVLLPEYGGLEVKLAADKVYLLFGEHDILGTLVD